MTKRTPAERHGAPPVIAGRRGPRAASDPWDVAVRVTTARVACATCGPVIVPFDDVELVAARESIWYQFACRTCGRANTVITAPYATDLLVLSGIRVRLVPTPSEIEEHHENRPWSASELDALFADIEALGPPEDDETDPVPDGHGLGEPLSDGSGPTSGPDPDRRDRGPAEP